MKKTSTVRIFVSSILETIWAAGVSSVVGHLSTQAHSTHNKRGQAEKFAVYRDR